MAEIAGWPLKSNIIRGSNREVRLHNTFGMVRRDANGRPKAHQGWDFSADIGSPAFAVADGTVKLIYTSPDYGLVLVLAFKWGGRTLYAAYAHLSATKQPVGATVKRGDVLCLTGESGNAKGMPKADRHLHFEVRGEPRPPRGLVGRMSPLLIFGKVPLDEPILADLP